MYDEHETPPVALDGWWDILAPGVWPASRGDKPVQWEVTTTLLRELVETYDPAYYLAPVSVDHKQEGEALAYVGELRLYGDKLQAKLRDFTSSGRWLIEGNYVKNRSVEVSAQFRDTGKPYLTGLTFLGAGKPAVAGLSPEPLAFSAHGERTIAVCFSAAALTHEEDEMDKQEMQALQDGFFSRMTGWLKDNLHLGDGGGGGETATALAALTQQVSTLGAELAAKTAALSTTETALAAAQARVTELEAAAAKSAADTAAAEYGGKLDQLVAAGKITPAEKDAYVSLAAGQSPEQRAQLLSALDLRAGTRVFDELSAADKPQAATPGRMAYRRKSVQADLLAAQAANDQDVIADCKRTLACFDLMDKNQELTFSAALQQVDSTAI